MTTASRIPNISDIGAIRSGFPIFKMHPDLVYLDFASTSQTPQIVLDAMDRYYREQRANVHRGLYGLAADATKSYEGARLAIASFLNAEANEIIFTSGTTAALNGLARSLTRDLKPGDEIVLTAFEHHANLVPWQEVTREKNLKLNIIPLREDLSLDLAAAEQMINARTKVVAFSWISNVLGTVTDIVALSALAKKVGAIVVIDAAQVAGHRNIDVKMLAQLGVDVVVFSGHKMYGPTGIGVIWARLEILETLHPWLTGGNMISEVTYEAATWADVPGRFEAGTPPIAEAIGLGAAARWLMDIGWAAIERHEQEMTEVLIRELSSIPEVKIFGSTTSPKEPYDHAGVVSFAVNGIHPHDLATLLDREQICVRAGHHCAMPLMKILGESATTRASIGLTTTQKDIARLGLAIRNAIDFLHGDKRGDQHG